MSFPGLTEYLLSGQFTLQHGISPSIATFNCAPVPSNKIVENGTLDFRFGTVRITFPGCKIDKIDVYKNEDGLERWSVAILDRRWKWKFAGEVSGRWNVRNGEILAGQNKIVKETAKSAKELAEICLDAMGEQRYDTSEFPKDVFPEVEWDLTNAADALAQLCDKFGFRVVLEINDRVALRKVGVGRQIPIVGDETQLNVTLDPPERPEKLKFAGGPDRYQYDLELECVLRDFDGKWKPINELSYAPKDGAGRVLWGPGGFSPFTQAEIDANPLKKLYNNYILTNLWKTWRIKDKFEIDVWKAGNLKTFPFNREDILPIEPTLCDTEIIDGWAVEKEPIIYGLWSGGGTGRDSTYHITGGAGGIGYEQEPTGDVFSVKDPLDPDTKGKGKCAKALYTLSYDINFTNGYVQFADPAVRLRPMSAKEDADFGVVTVSSGAPLRSWLLPAKLWLRCAFSTRLEPQDGAALFYRLEERKLPGKPVGSGTEFVRATDIRYKAGQWKDVWKFHNGPEFEKTAKHYLDEKQKEYELGEFASATVAGFKAYNPDGALQQVSWEVTDRGFAMTRVSRNKEELFAGVSYSERRLFERTKFLLDHPGAAIGMVPGGGA